MLANLEWARGIARKVAHSLPTWFTVEDLVGPAEIGLLQAAERYDPSRNDSFRAYAQRRVYGECIASVRRREYRERAFRSLDSPAGHADAQCVMNREERSLVAIASTPGPDREAQLAIAGARMRERVRQLGNPHARVLWAHYWAEMTLVEIGARLGVSESRVCQLHREGLEMLRLTCRDLAELAA